MSIIASISFNISSPVSSSPISKENTPVLRLVSNRSWPGAASPEDSLGIGNFDTFAVGMSGKGGMASDRL